jgi:hypothetical protein
MRHQDVPAANVQSPKVFSTRKLAGICLRACPILLVVCAILTAQASAQTTFYVTTSGNDSWNGLSPTYTGGTNGPFASLAKAQLAVQPLARTQAVTVEVGNGTFYLPLSPTNPGTLIFGTADSGSATYPIVWKNYPGALPVVNGGVLIGAGGLNLTWQNVSGNLWTVQLPANIANNQPLQPFEYFFYNGARRLRSRLESPLGVGYYMSNGSCISTQTKKAVNISFCSFGTMLRVYNTISPGSTGCPSVSSGGRSKCLDRFEYNPQETTITNWINLNGTTVPSQPCQASNNYPSGDIGLLLFEAWTVASMRINCVDTTNHIVYLLGTTQGAPAEFDYFGPTPGHRYFVENTKDAFETAMTAGQTGLWFLDRSTNPPVLNYIANPGENPNSDSQVIPQLPFPQQLSNQFPQSVSGQESNDFIGGSLLWATNLSYVTFMGIHFSMDNFVPSYATGFNNDTNGELSVPQAIDCESCQNVTFNGITVSQTSGSGILIASSSGNSGTPAINDLLENSTFTNLGDSGIRVGHYPQLTDSASYVVSNLTVQNNLVDGYSRVFPPGEGIAEGNGNTISYLHNDVTDGYHAGLTICQETCPGAQFGANGTDILTEYNHIWNMMQGITADGGALYYNVGGPTGSGTGNKIYNNLVHDVSDSSIIDLIGDKYAGPGSGFGGEGIYLDAQTAGADIRYNVVYHISGHALHVTGGPIQGQPSNFYSNNIISLARRAMFMELYPWLDGCYTLSQPQIQLYDNIFNFDKTVDLNNPYTSFIAIAGCTNSCGQKFSSFQDLERNTYWRVKGGFGTDTHGFRVLKKQAANGSCPASPPPPTAFDWLTFDTPKNGADTWQHGKPPSAPVVMNEDPGSTAGWNPHFGTSGKPSDYILQKSPPISGFDITQTNSTINSAGRTSGAPPATIPATFPTYLYTSF